MTKKKSVPKVFIDANVVIQAGKPPGGPILTRVADLVKAELIEVLTTDLTVTEVAKKHAENDYEVIKEVGRPHFRKVVAEALGVALPETSKAELKAGLLRKYEKLTRELFKGLSATILPVDDVKPSTVFTSYAEGTGFFSGEGKKDQFPDAFIFECLKAQASSDSPVIIVSDDGDFEKPAEGEPDIQLLTSLPDLFEKLGLQVEAPEVNAFLNSHQSDLLKAVDRELSDWGLQATDVEDADIEETAVTAVDIEGLASFGSSDGKGPILVVGRMSITATATYTHPNWDEAIYDSEEGRLIPFGDVSGETDVSLDADFSMSITVDKNGHPARIEDFRFRNDDFLQIELYPYDPYS